MNTYFFSGNGNIFVFTEKICVTIVKKTIYKKQKNKMAAHLFNESGQMQEVDIPDIFDVLEGGEDESAVKVC